MSETHESGLGEAVSDISSRLPRYGKLSASLMKEGWLSAANRSPLMHVLGAGGFSRLALWVPLFRQLNQVLATVGAMRSILKEMQAGQAERHLDAAGLTREQIERDYHTISSITKRYTSDGVRGARKLAREGIRKAGRATGKGLRAFQRWRDQ